MPAVGPDRATERRRPRRGRRGNVVPADDGGEAPRIKVKLPEEPPPLSPQACRLLLEVLVQLTTVEVLDPLPEGLPE
jgi:hypothetical protein